jgi:hypothetical protein
MEWQSYSKVAIPAVLLRLCLTNQMDGRRDGVTVAAASGGVRDTVMLDIHIGYRLSVIDTTL